MDKIKELNAKIYHLKKKLAATDYKAIKYAEGELTESEFAPIREDRRKCRTEINAYETMLSRLQNNG